MSPPTLKAQNHAVDQKNGVLMWQEIVRASGENFLVIPVPLRLPSVKPRAFVFTALVFQNGPPCPSHDQQLTLPPQGAPYLWNLSLHLISFIALATANNYLFPGQLCLSYQNTPTTRLGTTSALTIGYRSMTQSGYLLHLCEMHGDVSELPYLAAKFFSPLRGLGVAEKQFLWVPPKSRVRLRAHLVKLIMFIRPLSTIFQPSCLPSPLESGWKKETTREHTSQV